MGLQTFMLSICFSFSIFSSFPCNHDRLLIISLVWRRCLKANTSVCGKFTWILFLMPKLVLHLVHGTEPHLILFAAHHGPEYHLLLVIKLTSRILLLGCGVNSVHCISKQSVESDLTVLSCFYDYKMSHTDDITSYIQHINKLALLFQDFLFVIFLNWSFPISSPAFHRVTTTLLVSSLMFLKHNKLWIVSKIIFSDTNIFFELKAAWMMLITKPSFVHITHPIHSLTKKEQHQRHLEYIRDLKARTKCYHCGITSQWSVDCKKPRKKRHFGKNDPAKTDHGLMMPNWPRFWFLTHILMSTSTIMIVCSWPSLLPWVISLLRRITRYLVCWFGCM